MAIDLIVWHPAEPVGFQSADRKLRRARSKQFSASIPPVVDAFVRQYMPSIREPRLATGPVDSWDWETPYRIGIVGDAVLVTASWGDSRIPVAMVRSAVAMGLTAYCPSPQFLAGHGSSSSDIERFARELEAAERDVLTTVGRVLDRGQSMSVDMIVASRGIQSVQEAYETSRVATAPDASVVAEFGAWIDARADELGLAVAPCERLGDAALLVAFRLDADEAMKRVYQEAKTAGLRVFDPGSGLEG